MCCLNEQFSCVHPPLLNIPLENVVLDEMHLMLRITGKLFIFYHANTIFDVFNIIEIVWYMG